MGAQQKFGDLMRRRPTSRILAVGMVLGGVFFLYLTIAAFAPANWGLPGGAANPIGGDFPALYAAGHEALHGSAIKAYDPAYIVELERRLRGVEYAYLPFVYPPVALFALVPVAALPFFAAFWIWVGVGFGAVTLAAHRVVGHWTGAALVVLTPAAVKSAMTGQTALFMTLALLGGFQLLERRPWAAGAVFGLLAIKPQLAILLPFCLVAGGHWRTVLAMGAMALGLALASVVVFGIELWPAFLEAGVRQAEVFFAAGNDVWSRMPTITVGVTHGGGGAGLAAVAQGISTLLAIALGVWVWRRTTDLAARSLAALAALPLATPYLIDYDLAVLVVPMVYLYRHLLAGREFKFADVILCLLWCLPPIAVGLAERSGVQWGALGFVPLLLYALYLARAD